ncbi:hypothetical protein B0T20DRAFT_87976 [Sordaria brevicollis]|uniref:Secreted protein n=1 Tax=Sordaria brevicollis TaxID=83679 RepID=A0AAE0NW76_SORBR|nr:hypothetical protein B0T20DRAFT_87976 [Sordaria brevicollis]
MCWLLSGFQWSLVVPFPVLPRPPFPVRSPCSQVSLRLSGVWLEPEKASDGDTAGTVPWQEEEVGKFVSFARCRRTLLLYPPSVHHRLSGFIAFFLFAVRKTCQQPPNESAKSTIVSASDSHLRSFVASLLVPHLLQRK